MNCHLRALGSVLCSRLDFASGTAAPRLGLERIASGEFPVLGLSEQSPLVAFAPFVMKEAIHPKYQDAEIRCACGNVIATRSTKPVVIIGICNACHPFYTGTQKFVDTAGRVDKFQQRMAKTKAAQDQAAVNAAARKKRK
jgi:large subunit ribosomal protein L31